MLKKMALPMMFLCILVLSTLSVLPARADVNGDGVWDIVDISMMIRALGTDKWDYLWDETGHLWDYYNPHADLDSNGYVDMFDWYIAEQTFKFGDGVTTLTSQGLGPVRVNPPPITYIGPVGVNNYFTINVVINIPPNQPELSLYQFMLFWDHTKIQYDSVTEGPFLNQGGTYYTTFRHKDTYMPMDRLLVGCSVTQQVTVSGSGTLATVRFKCIATGSTFITLISNLYDNNLYGIDHLDGIPANGRIALVNQ